MESGREEGLIQHLPSPTLPFTSELNPAFVVPRELLAKLLASNLRLEKILANPYSHLLEQIELGIRRVLDDPNLSMEEKNQRYASLLTFQEKVKDGMVETSSWSNTVMLPSSSTPPSTLSPPTLSLPAITVSRPPSPAQASSLTQNSTLSDEARMSTRATSSSQLNTGQRSQLMALPVEQRLKAEELLKQLNRWPQTFSENKFGNMVLNGRLISGSNSSDVLAALFKQTPPNARSNPSAYWQTRLPIGTEDFLKAYSQTPLGAGLIRNDYLASMLQRIRQNSTPSPIQQLQQQQQHQEQSAHRALIPKPSRRSSSIGISPYSFNSFAKRYRALRAQQNARIQS